jgi:hypothetical protein
VPALQKKRAFYAEIEARKYKPRVAIINWDIIVGQPVDLLKGLSTL